MVERTSSTRITKSDLPVIAICYDFDKTLSPDDMQSQGFIQATDQNVEAFWKQSNQLAVDNDMDQNLAYMYQMLQGAEGNILFKREELGKYGSKLKLFDGVLEWFDRINAYGLEKGVKVEHYIISSGLREMIEGTPIASKFERIYASSFYFSEKGVAKWPAQVVNFTNKTQFLFRIQKGVLDINDQAVNDVYEDSEIRVPFRNMIYIGDSDTDIPCMTLVNKYGGHSIGVYDPIKKDKSKVYKMIRDKRINYFVPADYQDGKELDQLIKTIIDKTASCEALIEKQYECQRENKNIDSMSNEDEQYRLDLITQLKDSGSFVTTHEIISLMSPIETWTDDEKHIIFETAVNNSQVFYIVTDDDLRRFFEKLLQTCKHETEYTEALRMKLDIDLPF